MGKPLAAERAAFAAMKNMGVGLHVLRKRTRLGWTPEATVSVPKGNPRSNSHG